MEMVHVWMLKLVEVIGASGYGGIFIRMLLESTCIPVPSELVMPPAGYLASVPPGDPHHMSLALVILVGTLGCMAGASINYALAHWLGRPFFARFGKYLLLPPHKFEKMERFFNTHGEISTFTGRLILGLRHFISIPAGLARMNVPRFLFYTGLGSGIWCAILAVLGFWVGKNQELIVKYAHQAALGATAACVLMIVLYVANHRRKQRQV